MFIILIIFCLKRLDYVGLTWHNESRLNFKAIASRVPTKRDRLSSNQIEENQND